jgi:hypothetical protein
LWFFFFPLLSGPKSSYISNNSPLLKMVPGSSTLICGVMQWIASLMLFYHPRGVTIRPNAHPGFKECENCGFLLLLPLF